MDNFFLSQAEVIKLVNKLKSDLGMTSAQIAQELTDAGHTVSQQAISAGLNGRTSNLKALVRWVGLHGKELEFDHNRPVVYYKIIETKPASAGTNG